MGFKDLVHPRNKNCLVTPLIKRHRKFASLRMSYTSSATVLGYYSKWYSLSAAHFNYSLYYCPLNIHSFCFGYCCCCSCYFKQEITLVLCRYHSTHKRPVMSYNCIDDQRPSLIEEDLKGFMCVSWKAAKWSLESNCNFKIFQLM